MRKLSPIFEATRTRLVSRVITSCINSNYQPLAAGHSQIPHTRSIASLQTTVRIPHPPRPVSINWSRTVSNMSLAEAQEETKGLSGTSDLGPTKEQHKKINAWSGPGPAAFDFRSMPNETFLHSTQAHYFQAML